jgi:hypothetical protein
MPKLRLRAVSTYAIVVAVLLGVGMVVIGSLFMAMGFDAKRDINNALLKERVITSQDATIPGVLVQDAETARAQQDAIETHTFGRFGPYSGMERDDPNREVYLNGLTLRNALNLAIVGYGVADLAIGVGAVTIVLGLIIGGFAVPVHLLVLKVQRHDFQLETLFARA